MCALATCTSNNPLYSSGNDASPDQSISGPGTGNDAGASSGSPGQGPDAAAIPSGAGGLPIGEPSGTGGLPSGAGGSASSAGGASGVPTADAGDPALVVRDGAAAGTHDLVTGLIGYWRMDEAPGSTVAHDSSGLHHDGTLETLDPKVAWVAGRFGSAVDFPQNGDRNPGIRVAVTTRISSVTQYTIAAWVRRNRSRPTAYQSIISRQLGTTFAEVFDMSVSLDHLATYGTDRTDQGVTAAAGLDDAPVGVWFHAAATFDGTKLRVYADGVQLAVVDEPKALPSTDTPLYLGTNKNSSTAISDSNHPWEGQLDEIVLYERALPPESIAALAQGERPNVP